MMTSDHSAPALAVRVTDVSKVYRLWATPGSRLLVPLVLRLTRLPARWSPAIARRVQTWVDQRMRLHKALEGISLDLPRGHALGIVGLNGSGKSTLLQIIAGVLQPSAGSVEVRGRIAALLELGSGFNPEMTGRENVILNAAVLGMPRARAEVLMERILAFADIGEYVDQPVKTYSSGMVVRLGFAVQVHMEPDILIVDEALAVGDAEFQARAMARIDEILSTGTTLLFVGHDLNAIRAFCREAMLLEKGRIVMRGSPEDVTTEYLYRIHQKGLRERVIAEATATEMARIDHGYGTSDACVVAASINDAPRHASLRFDAAIAVWLRIRLTRQVRAPHLILDIMDGKGLQLSGRRIALPADHRDDHVELHAHFRASFQKGVYRLRLRIVDAPSLEQTQVLARQEGWISFEVVDDSRDSFTGLFPLPMEIRIDP